MSKVEVYRRRYADRFSFSKSSESRQHYRIQALLHEIEVDIVRACDFGTTDALQMNNLDQFLATDVAKQCRILYGEENVSLTPAVSCFRRHLTIQPFWV